MSEDKVVITRESIDRVLAGRENIDPIGYFSDRYLGEDEDDFEPEPIQHFPPLEEDPRYQALAAKYLENLDQIVAADTAAKLLNVEDPNDPFFGWADGPDLGF